MSGAFACACSAVGPAIMADLVLSNFGRSGRRPAAISESPRPSGGGRISRTERLEIISFVATTEMTECFAWVISILERSGLNEDASTETWKC